VIGLTTGREPSQRLNSLLKELARAIPNARVVRRGKSGFEDLGRRFNEAGLGHAIILHRWHGGPGRMDFFQVEAKSLKQVPPSILLGTVKLGREYAHRRKHVARAITCDANVSETTRRFARQLSMVLGLPESPLSATPEIGSTFHISESKGGSVLVALTSPEREEVGPRLVVSRLIWDLHD
jgi:rRNA maturation protein Rpf1